MRNTFARELFLRAKNDPSIILVTGDLGYGVLDEFSKELPNQYINSGINEQSMMSMAAGLASQGFRPFVYSIANFPTFRCLEQIRNDVCYMNNPVTIVSVGAGLGYGSHGYSHYAIEDVAAMRILPNMSIYSPADPIETTLCLDELLNIKRPAYLRLGKGGEVNLNESETLELRNLRVVVDGPAAVIASTGGIGKRGLEAVQLLEKDGINVALVSMPVINNQRILDLLRFAGDRPILTLEEHVLRGGFGSWVLEVMNSEFMCTKLRRMGVGENFQNLIGSQEYLLDNMGLKPINIANTIKDCITA